MAGIVAKKKVHRYPRQCFRKHDTITANKFVACLFRFPFELHVPSPSTIHTFRNIYQITRYHVPQSSEKQQNIYVMRSICMERSQYSIFVTMLVYMLMLKFAPKEPNIRWIKHSCIAM